MHNSYSQEHVQSGPAASAWNQFFPSFVKSYGKEAYKFLQESLGQKQTGSVGVEPWDGRSDRNYYDLAKRERAINETLKKDIHQEQLRFHDYQQRSEQRIQILNDVAEKLKLENEAFRAQIFTMGSGRGPLKEENYYIQVFNSLNSVIDQGVLRLVRQAKHLLSDTAPNEILALISDLGDHGKQSATFLATSSKYSVPALYSQVPLRLALIRHVVALFLVHRVFEPYGFGLSQEFSEGLNYVEKDLLSNGSTLFSPN
jgi:hypothetical protein